MKRLIRQEAHLYVPTLLLCFLIAFYFAYQKTGYHVDELYSFGLANSYGNPFPNAINQWLSGKYYHDYLSTDWQHRFNYLAVYRNQVQDVHPPFYYFLLHTIASLFPGSFNKWIGLSLNLVIQTISLSSMILIGRQISDKRQLPYFMAILWAISVGGLNTVLFIRMYSLLTCMGLLLLYQLLKLIDKSSSPLTRFLTISLIVFFGSLTHYYFIIYAGFLFILCLIIKVWQGQWKFMFKIGTSGLLGLGLAYGFFPVMIHHLTQSNRGSETFSNLNQIGLSQNLLTYLKFLNSELLGKMPWVVFLAIFILSFIVYFAKTSNLAEWQNKFFQRLLIIGPALAFFLLVQVISHYQTPRYIYQIYPQIIIYFSYYLFSPWLSFKHWLKYSGLAIFILLLAFNLYQPSLTYTYPQQEQVNQAIAAFPHDKAIVITDKKWKMIRVTNPLQTYTKVYPWLPKTLNLADFPKLTSQTRSLDIYILDQPFPLEKILESIKQAYPKFDCQLAYQDASLHIIHLE